MDELWSYLKRKKCQLWVFISLEVCSRFWLGFELGSRTLHTANRLVAQFKRFGNWMGETLLKVTTDKLAAYKNALEKQFTKRPYHYLQIVKRRVKRRLVTVKKCFVKGTEEDFPLVGEFHSCAPKSKLRPQGCLKTALQKSSGMVQI